MFQYKGIWLPDGEVHYQTIMDNRKSPEIDGKATYQYRKLMAVMGVTPEPRFQAIDIGANIGFWSMHMSKLFTHIHCFEPVFKFRECFERNMEGLTNFTLHPEALGETEMRWPLVLGHEGHSGDTYLDPDYDGEDDVPLVDVTTLDSYNYKEVSFIKIDCEGYELFILKGAKETILKSKPTIIVEQKPNRAQKFGLGETDAVTYLEGLGMTCVKNFSGDFIMIWEGR